MAPQPLSSLDDSQLVQRILAGQVEEPWEVLLQRYLEMAIDTGHFIVKQEWPERTDMAEDIALESFGKAHFGLHTFNQDLSFPAWLRTIVANTARDRIRKERGPKYSRHTHHTDHLDEMATDEETPVSSLIHREDRDFARRHMETMLHSLTHSEQELLLDRFLRRLPIDVIAGKLHLAEQTVRGNLTRAKQTLLRKLNLPENLTNREVEQLFQATLAKPSSPFQCRTGWTGLSSPSRTLQPSQRLFTKRLWISRRK